MAHAIANSVRYVCSKPGRPERLSACSDEVLGAVLSGSLHAAIPVSSAMPSSVNLLPPGSLLACPRCRKTEDTPVAEFEQFDVLVDHQMTVTPASAIWRTRSSRCPA